MSYRQKHIKPKFKRLKPKKNILKMPLFWILFVVVFLLAIGVYIGFFYSKLQIQSVEVLGNQQIISEDIQSTVFTLLNKKIFFLSFKNIALVNTVSLEASLMHAFPNISTVRIKKVFPRDLVVTLEERKPVANVCAKNENNCYLLDKEGVMFEKISTSDVSFMTIYEQKVSQATVGDTVLGKDILTVLTKLENKLKEEFSLNIVSVDVADLLIVTTSEGFAVYFDFQQNMNLQISKLETLLAGQITPEARKNLSYIYLQYKDRAYYK